jgi:hypothetical protein
MTTYRDGKTFAVTSRTPGGGSTVRITRPTGTPGTPLHQIQAAGAPPRVSRAQLDAIDRQRDADGYPAMPDIVVAPDPATLAAVERERERVCGNRATAQPTTPDNVLDEYYPHEWLPEVWDQS